ncbi:hypothetical protein NNO_0855 [Hydrogenimonas sp.]|nr:hypothetical protein NNO_0855 [Hydrogenimonas sp.]
MFVMPLALYAQIHYAKLEPVETYQIKSAVSGKVLFADDSLEGSVGGPSPVVKIDDAVDREQREALKITLDVLEETLELTKDMVENQERVYSRDRDYYERIKDLKTKSKTEKDRIFAAMATSKNQLLSLKEKLASLRQQIADTRFRIAQLEDIIKKKSVAAEGLYIYKVAVRADDYVNPGVVLLTAMDTSRGRLSLFLDADEVENIDSKKIYLNGKETNLKFSKVLKVADTVHISSYRAEIIVNKPEGLFSKLVKVEIK